MNKAAVWPVFLCAVALAQGVTTTTRIPRTAKEIDAGCAYKERICRDGQCEERCVYLCCTSPGRDVTPSKVPRTAEEIENGCQKMHVCENGHCKDECWYKVETLLAKPKVTKKSFKTQPSK